MRLLSSLVLLLLFLVPLSASADGSPIPREQVLNFSVTRNGGVIGHHRYSIKPRRDGFEVKVDADIRVEFLTIPFFIYQQRGTELWENGRLKTFDYVTNDDGARHAVKAEAVPGGLKVIVDDRPPALHPDMPPGSLWRRPPPQAAMMLDPGDGNPTPLKVQVLGTETLNVGGRPVRTVRCLWDDGLRREVWYDDNHLLVQVFIKGDDGSDIYYVLN